MDSKLPTTFSYYIHIFNAYLFLLINFYRWRRTLDMAQALCELQFELKGHKRKRVTNPRSKAKNSADEVQSIGNFPNSMELNILDEETLKKRCNLGYRAKIILELATSIENGEVKLQNFEKALDAESMEKIYDMLNKKKGFGPFACANILMCIGYYQRIPTDSETFRHVKEVWALVLLWWSIFL